jgi:putative Holliday junction resolvase
MAIRNPGDLKAALRPGQRILGLDVGTKTIGIAIADSSLTVASPLETLKRGKFQGDAERLRKIIAERQVGALVIGLPLNMDGSEGPRCQSVRQFARNLLERLETDIAFWDERLSTAAVTRTLIEADASRKRRAELVDKLAASYILQGALDAMKHAASIADEGGTALTDAARRSPAMRAPENGILALDHVQVTVPKEREEEAKRFYGEILGLREIEKPTALKARGGAWYALGPTQFHLAIEPGADGGPSRRHVCFRVADLEAMRTRLAAAGCIIDEEQPQADGLSRFFTRDPAGNRIEIGERAH